MRKRDAAMFAAAAIAVAILPSSCSAVTRMSDVPAPSETLRAETLEEALHLCGTFDYADLVADCRQAALATEWSK